MSSKRKSERNWQRDAVTGNVTSIKSNPQNPAARRAKYLKNREVRAQVNTSSSNKSNGYTFNNCSEFHTQIRALSLGTAT